MENLIEIRGLTWGYPQSPTLLFNQYDLSLAKGDFCVIMGKAGTGKTSLIKLISGEKKSPSKTIFYKRDDIAKYDAKQLQLYRRRLGILFQEEKLIDYMSIKENIIYPLALYGIGETIIESKYKKIKQKYLSGFDDDTLVKSLSSGEKQKIGMARALIHEPDCILADEPTGNLDRENTQQLADLLIEANQEGTAILLITHDIHLVNYLKETHKVRIELLK
ncbi:MAG: ABC transporter ATP-binding protein [Candidatus Absconditabacteria bacterium]|jgi:ABC-type lipoprotein export system ATPase subunit